ncbi:unnamed protein product [Cuscuta epithymum]|uniref:Tudor domain-containing protein n=1 Tax=Cuscuta epithymum TaxID=186058 RepID=A0AAV0CF52_9ASTE|nr:unnamed protein product [Cuscuta epithymum]
MASSSALRPHQIEFMENVKQLTAQLLTTSPDNDDLLSLLEKIESALGRMVPGPHKLLRTDFNVIKELLGDRKFLLHPNKFIETCVASCMVEVMRITAPSRPYDNEKMKLVFHQLIASVESLPHVLSGYYRKAVSILARMVNIRGFVALWDIDDWLALNIFQLPLKIIMPYHPDREKENMEAIMVQMIEECDGSPEIILDILFPLFECLRKKTQMDAPMSSLLAHQVLEKCAAKLNPHLLKAVKLLGMKVEGYTDQFLTLCRKLAEEEKVAEKVGALSAIEGTSEVQRPDVTPRAMNIDNFNQEFIGSSLKAKCSNQAEQLKDVDIPALHNHENTKDLQQVDPSGPPEKIEPTKEQDCLGMNGSENWVEEPNNINKKEHEKQLGSSSGDATSEESPLPSETEKNMSEMTERTGPSKEKQGKGLCKDDEATPSVVTKKEVHETVGEVEKAPVQPNDLQKVEKGIAVSSIEGVSGVQLPDITPVAMNIGSNNQEPVGSPLKAECGDQAEQLKDADKPADQVHENTTDLQQQVDLSRSPEKIEPRKEQDCLGTYGSQACIEEANNNKECEKQFEGATPGESPLSSKTETQMSEMAETNGSSKGKQGNGSCNDDEATPGVVNDDEQLKDADKPADQVNENTKDLQQQVDLSRSPEKIEPRKEQDCLGTNGSQACIEEANNNKEHEKQSEGATPGESPLPPKTETHMSEMAERNGSSKGKQGNGSCNDDEVTPGVVNTKKEVDEVVSEVEKPPVHKNDIQNANTRTKLKRKQALNKEKVEKGVALSSIEGISDAQLPDITPVAMNIGSSNQEPVGSPLKAKCGDQAEQLKDGDKPADQIHENTKDLQQQVDLSRSAEKTDPRKEQDFLGTNGSQACIKEANNNDKEHEKQSEGANPGESPLPLKTETHMSEMVERNGSSKGKQGNGSCNDDEVTPGVVNTKKEVDEVVSEVEEKPPVQKNDLQNAHTRTKRKRKQGLNKEKVKKGGAVSAIEETSDVQLPNVTPKSMIIDNINQEPIGPPLKAECGSQTEQLKGADKPAEVRENTKDLQQQVYLSRLPEKREPIKERDCLGMSESENYVEEPQNNNNKNKKEHEKRSEDATSKESPLPSETKKHTHRRAQPNKKKSEMTVRSGSKGARSSKGKQGKGSCKDDEAEKGGAISTIEGMSEKIEPRTEQDCLGINGSEKCVKDSENNNKEHENQSEDATSGVSPLPPKTEQHKSVMTERNGSKGARSFKGKLGKSPCNDNEATSGVVKIREEGEEEEKGGGGISDLEKPHAQKNELQNTSTRTKRKRKEVLNKEKDSKNHVGKDYGEELIGAIIRVWWPLDRKFYKGTISSFDPETKKHKIKYIDNDVETLNLNLERWEMLEEASVKEEHVFDSPSLVSTTAGEKAKKGTSKKKESGASSSKRASKKAGTSSGSKLGKTLKSGKALSKDNEKTNS